MMVNEAGVQCRYNDILLVVVLLRFLINIFFPLIYWVLEISHGTECVLYNTQILVMGMLLYYLQGLVGYFGV